MKLRRALLSQDSEPELRYWLCGDDAPVDGKWVDRITGDTWTLYNGASYDATNKLYLFTRSNQGAAFDGDFSTGMNLGHHWIFDFDIYINRSESKQSLVFFDIGAVTNATKAIGFSCGTVSGDPGSSCLLNWKIEGNDSNPFPSSMNHSALPLMPSDEYVHATGKYRLIDGGDGYDRLQATINGQSVLYDTKIPQAYYTNWSSDRPYAMVGRSVYNRPTGTANTYGLSCRIKSLKIYVID